MQSAFRASALHKQRTGKEYRIDEKAVQRCQDFEEIDPEVKGSARGASSTAGATRNIVLDSSNSKQLASESSAGLRSAKERRQQDIDQAFDRFFPNAQLHAERLSQAIHAKVPRDINDSDANCPSDASPPQSSDNSRLSREKTNMNHEESGGLLPSLEEWNKRGKESELDVPLCFDYDWTIEPDGQWIPDMTAYDHPFTDFLNVEPDFASPSQEKVTFLNQNSKYESTESMCQSPLSEEHPEGFTRTRSYLPIVDVRKGNRGGSGKKRNQTQEPSNAMNTGRESLVHGQTVAFKRSRASSKTPSDILPELTTQSDGDTGLSVLDHPDMCEIGLVDADDPRESWLISHNPESLARILGETYIDDDAIRNVFQIVMRAIGAARFTCLDSISMGSEGESESGRASKMLLPIYLESTRHFVSAIIPEDRASVRIYDPAPSEYHLKQAVRKTSTVLKRLGVDNDTQKEGSYVSYRAPIIQTDNHSCGVALIVTGLYEALDMEIPQGQLHVPLWRHVIWMLLQPLCHEEQLVVIDTVSKVIDLSPRTLQTGLPIIRLPSIHDETAPADAALHSWIAEAAILVSRIDEVTESIIGGSRFSSPQIAQFERLRSKALENLQSCTNGVPSSKNAGTERHALKEAIVRINRVIVFLEGRVIKVQKAKELQKIASRLKGVLQG